MFTRRRSCLLTCLATHAMAAATALAQPPTTVLTEPGVAFMPNLGQVGESARFHASQPSFAAELRPSGGALAVLLGYEPGRNGAAVTDTFEWRFEGASTETPMAGEKIRPGATHFEHADQSRSVRDVPSYLRVRYLDLYPGITHTVWGPGGRPQLDFDVEPGGDPMQIVMSFVGAKAAPDSGGRVALSLPHGTVHLSAPKAWQGDGADRVNVPIAYRFTDTGAVGFSVGAYDTKQTLFIDPTIEWTFWLADGAARGFAVDTDGGSNAYIAANSLGLGVTFISLTKIDPTGIPVFTTLVASADMIGRAMDVNASGEAYIVGDTHGALPIRGPYTRYGGAGDGFALKLDGSGRLLSSRYVGGGGEDRAVSVRLAPDGSTYIFGDTGSSDFLPMAGGVVLPSRLLGPPDLFVMRLDWTGRPTDMFTLGSWREDYARAMTVDGQAIYITGDLHGPLADRPNDYPHAPAFIAKIASISERTLAWVTWVPHVLSPFSGATAIAVHPPSGTLYAAGATVYPQFEATRLAFREYITRPHADGTGILESHGNELPFCPPEDIYHCADGWVATMDATNGVVLMSTYLGDYRQDFIDALAVDADGRAYVTGRTERARPGSAESMQFPLTSDAWQSFHGGGDPLTGWIEGGLDSFLVVLDASLSTVSFGTLSGGSVNDAGRAIAIDGSRTLLLEDRGEGVSLMAIGR